MDPARHARRRARMAGEGAAGPQGSLPLHCRPEGGRGGVAAPSGPRGPQPSGDPPGRARLRRRAPSGTRAAAARDLPWPAPGATALPPAPARRSCWDLRAGKGRGRLRGVAGRIRPFGAVGRRQAFHGLGGADGGRAGTGGRPPLVRSVRVTPTHEHQTAASSPATLCPSSSRLPAPPVFVGHEPVFWYNRDL